MNIQDVVDEYLLACYGGRLCLSTQQAKEVEQAFLSGMHYVLQTVFSPIQRAEAQVAVARRLVEIGSLPEERNYQ